MPLESIDGAYFEIVSLEELEGTLESIGISLLAAALLSTLAGGCVALRFHRDLHTLIALTGGVVVAVALFDVLPEALEAVDDPYRVTAVVGFGFLLFFIAERAVGWRRMYAATAGSLPVWGRSAGTQCGFLRNLTSNIRSASAGGPFWNPKLTIVNTRFDACLRPLTSSRSCWRG